MSKSWKASPIKNAYGASQKVIDRLRMQDAKNDIREALTAPQEAPRAK